MADTKISALTDGTTAQSGDLIPIARSGANYYITPGYLGTTLLGSTALSGATVTTSQPVLNLSQTWNAGAVTFTGLVFNAAGSSNANSASGSLLLDLQVGGTSKAYIRKDGAAFINSVLWLLGSATNLQDSSLNIASTAGAVTFNSDAFIRRAAAATLQLGAADAAAPVAQTLQVQSVVAGTTNTAGANFTINGSRGTGTGAGGSIIFQVAPAGSSGPAQNTYATALTIDSNRNVIAPVQIMAGTTSNAGQSTGLVANGIYLSGGLFYTSSTQIVIAASTGIYQNSVNYIGWGDGAVSTGTIDTKLFRDAANTLALRNSTNPQIFRAYSTTASGGSYGIFSAGVQPDGTTAAADTLYIGSAGAGAAMTKLAFVVNGTTQFDYGITYNNTTTVNATFGVSGTQPRLSVLGGGVNGARFSGELGTSNPYMFDVQRAQNGGGAYVSGVSTGDIPAVYLNGYIGSTSVTSVPMIFRSFKWDGSTGRAALAATEPVMSFGNGTTTILQLRGDGLVQFAGTTSSFPALKRSLTTLQVRLADDSGDAALQCGTQTAGGTALDVSGTGAASLFNVVNTTSGTLLSVVNSTSSTIFSVNDTVTTGTQVLGTSFGLSGNISAAAWTTSGIRYRNVAATLTDTSSSGTVATAYTDVFGGNTIAASSATTFTDYSTMRITAATAGTNVTLTNKWALSLGGGILIDDANNIAVGTTTGTKIGTSTSQKIGFWNTAPIAQPTTGVASATVAATGTGDVVAASTTFDGYTIPQIVKALRNAGLLA